MRAWTCCRYHTKGKLPSTPPTRPTPPWTPEVGFRPGMPEPAPKAAPLPEPTAPATGWGEAVLPLAAVVPVPVLAASLLSPLAAALVVLVAKGSGAVADGVVFR